MQKNFELAVTQKLTPDENSVPKRRKKVSREEKNSEVREAIFRAAVEVVGQHGYAKATIARITELAGIAQGTFYLYFSSRQALFEMLLPHTGEEMAEFISGRVIGSKNIYELEERGVRAFFEFMLEKPAFFRVFHEAAYVAPNAYREHFKLLSRRYVDSLERSAKLGQINDFERSEFEPLAYALMGIRHYLQIFFKGEDGEFNAEIDSIVEIYMKLIKGGLR